MMRIIQYLILLIPGFVSIAQTPADNEINYQAAIKWLDRKLNYNYYDPINSNWWINTFYVNENKEITIKNISTNNPRSANIQEKVYTIRKFKLQDINPNNIVITDINENQGRIVKGRLMQLHTFSNQKKIAKTIDGRRASNASFVLISFPESMNSITDYHELIKENLIKAIESSTKVYHSEDDIESKTQIFNMLPGNFKSDEGQSLSNSVHYANLIALAIEEDADNYFGFQEKTGFYFLLRLSGNGVVIKNYRLITADKITLQNVEDSNDLITIETLNSFRMNGDTYHRE